VIVGDPACARVVAIIVHSGSSPVTAAQASRFGSSGSGVPRLPQDFVSHDVSVALDERAARALRGWAVEHGVTLRLDRQLTAGQTEAQVLALIETADGRSAQKLILKVCSDDSDGRREPGRHADALRVSPPGFARRHLIEMAHDPIPVGDGRWLAFQRVAGNGLTDMRPLSIVLDGAANLRTGGASYGPQELTEACRSIVKSVLREWNPNAKVDVVPATTFLSWQMEQRLEPGGSLYKWAKATDPGLLESTCVSVGGEQVINPFAIVRDPSLSSGREVAAFVGRAHGDFHPENVLIQVIPALRVSNYRLIDLSRFSSGAPLSRDPIHLLLAIVARSLDHLSGREQIALIRLLTEPVGEARSHLPPWLSDTVTAIREEGVNWAGKDGLADEWRTQSTLSLLGGALVFAGRRTTADQHRDWYLRLAGHAAAAYLTPGHDQSGTEGIGSSAVASRGRGVPTRARGRGSAREESVSATIDGAGRTSDPGEVRTTEHGPGKPRSPAASAEQSPPRWLRPGPGPRRRRAIFWTVAAVAVLLALSAALFVLSVLNLGRQPSGLGGAGGQALTLTVGGETDVFADVDRSINGRVPVENTKTPPPGTDLRINLDRDTDGSGARVRVTSSRKDGTSLTSRLAQLDPDHPGECTRQAPWRLDSIEMIPAGNVCLLSSEGRLYVMKLVNYHTSPNQLDATFSLVEQPGQR
jgi:Ternary complex associated domain 9